ncbi:FMN-binding domain-containing protein [Arthrobacter sp. 9AX]|uniref:FMN-binding protein n=1 Tax=Arthrobacter sp. 9AX TaxID=2653131 RepID=UPI0012F0A872|nr:FMN-binding protein [Arthrobacter sp. 9AX]VXA93165.1 FMN-binding domain-containing protein [Arthrobacter sp. 9AX]
MKARGAVSAALASAGILLAGWQAGTQVPGVNATTITTTAAGSAGAGAGTTGSSSGAASGSSSGGTGSSAGGTGSTGSSATGSTGSSGTGATGSSGTGSSGTSGSESAASGTYTGTAVSTRFGAVQVQVTVSAGKITDITALSLTDTDRKSIQISNRAAPLLRTEVLAAQSASVKIISGATVTSNAYLTSLQAALDAANL